VGGDINAICQARGGITLNKPEKITNADEIKTLDDLAQLIKLYQDLTAIDFSTIPDSALKPLREMANRCHSAGSACFKNALVLFVDALEKAKFNANDRVKVDALLTQLRPIRDAFLKTLSSTNPTVSAKVRDRYNEIEKGNQTGFLHKRAIAALKSVIEELGLSLSKTTSDALKVGTEGWADRIKMDDINGSIKLSCQAGYEEPKPVAPPTVPIVPPPVVPVKVAPKVEPKKEEEFKPKFDFSLRLGLGYGDRVLGNNMYLLSSEDRGGFVHGGASGRLLLTPTMGLQLDYNGSGSYDFVKHSDRTPDNDNLVSNNDYGRLTFFGQPHKNVDFAVNAGWKHYRSDYPTTYNPDVNGLAEGFRINWRPVTNLSLNLDQGLVAGWTRTSYTGESSNAQGPFKVANIYGAPGVSYTAGPVTPFLGGIVGYTDNGGDAKGGVYGGYAGAGLKVGGHTADLRGQYVYDKTNSYFDRGLKILGRYAYGSEAFMLGLAAAYGFNPDDKRHAVTGMLFSDILLKKDLLWNNSLYLSPFFGAGYEQTENDNKKDNSVNLNGGLMLRFGDLRPAVMPDARPYSTTPLPEER